MIPFMHFDLSTKSGLEQRFCCQIDLGFTVSRISGRPLDILLWLCSSMKCTIIMMATSQNLYEDEIDNDKDSCMGEGAW